MSELKREFVISAAYDKRPKYGQHCVDFTFFVKGPKGAVQFMLYTGWYPEIIPTPDKPWQELSRPLKVGPMDGPMPADLGYHSPVPMHEDQTKMDGKCEHVPGGECYYDGSCLNAYRIFSIMVHEGGEAMWTALENYYIETFESRLGTRVATETAPNER